MNNLQTDVVPAAVVRRTFGATRERVYAAWTQAEVVRRWWGPFGVTVRDVRLDVREGGRYRIEMTLTDGTARAVGGVFSEVRPCERLAYTMRWEERDPASEYDTFVTLDFIEREGATEVVLKHTGFTDAAAHDRHEHGWNANFEQLAGVLAAA
ncbi:MAG: SRPBCC domain-containing protein [Candidatus Eremiobacteraeota bacterium]|nr:SRPBCC domain-containing protein [Candidatus Eremiobacteraeota bacterium]